MRSTVVVGGLLLIGCKAATADPESSTTTTQGTGATGGVETATSAGMGGSAGAVTDSGGATSDRAASDSSSTSSGGSGGSGGGSSGSAMAGQPIAYLDGERHSPITADIAERLQQMATAAKLDAHVYTNFGDAISAVASYMTCFSAETANYDLAGRDALDETIAHYRQGRIEGEEPFSRLRPYDFENATAASTLGVELGSLADLEGPSPVDVELDASSASLAIVQLGWVDTAYGGTSRLEFSLNTFRLENYARPLWGIVDKLLERGVVPVLRTIPAYIEGGESQPIARFYNAVMRAIAQARQIPLVDMYAELEPLTGHGLEPGDASHTLTEFPSGACQLTTQALAFGQNVMNLVTLEALDRTRRAMQGEALDATGPSVFEAGNGSHGDPYVLSRLPTSDLSHAKQWGKPVGCDTATAEAGVYYRLDLGEATPVRAVRLDPLGQSSDQKLHLYSETLDANSCRENHSMLIEGTLQPGTHWFGIEGSATDSEHLLLIMKCDAMDASCEGSL